MIDDPAQLLAPLVALAMSYVLFYEGLLYTIGSDSGFWERVRKLLPMLDEEAREQGFYTSYTVDESEHVGDLSMSKSDARELFVTRKRFIKAPLAAHKTDWEDRREFASLGLYDEYDREDIESWGKLKRFLMMALVIRKQLHVTLFWDEESESVVVTAHHEWSPYNVFKAYKHFIGKDYNVEKGVRLTAEKLASVDEFTPSANVES